MRARDSALALVPIAFAAVVFHPVAGAYFFSDDFLNLFHIANDDVLKYLVTPNGGHVLLARNAIFYATARLFGPDPRWFYVPALLTHLVNVWLVFRVACRLTGRPGLAAVGAAMWGVCPTVAETIGWYAVYGHVLVATTLLIILDQAIALADRGCAPSPRTRGLWYGLALVAATSFGTGIAVAMSLPLVLVALLPAGTSRSARGLPLASLLVVVPALYAALMWTYGRLAVTGENSEVSRLFTAIAGEPARVVPFGARLVAVGIGRLPLAFYYPSWLQEPRVLAALLAAFVAGTLVAAWRGSPSTRARIAALGLLLVASYGIIALGRACLIPDEGKLVNAFGRYHYVGQMVATLLLCLVVHVLTTRVPTPVRRAAVLGWFAFAVVAYVAYAAPVDQHADARRETASLRASLAEQIHAHPAGAVVYLPTTVFTPLPLPLGMFPGSAAVFTIFFPTNRVDGRDVRFVMQNPAVVEVCRAGRRTATLVVPPVEAATALPTQ